MPNHQRGVVLVIALIVLVAMTLAGIGLMRSVDTNTAVSGNLAFKQSTVQAADVALKQSLAWLVANSATGATNTNNGAGFFAADGAIPEGPGGEELFEQFDWDNQSVHLPADPATKNKLDYIIERQCSSGGSVNSFANHCAVTEITNTSGNCEGCSYLIGGGAGIEVPHPQYRVVVRVTGPRNTVSYVQGNQY